MRKKKRKEKINEQRKYPGWEDGSIFGNNLRVPE